MTEARPDLMAIVERALLRYALADPRPTLYADSFNTVFRVESSGSSYVLRVGPTRSIHAPGAARAERDWTDVLAAHGLPVPRVVAADDGSPSVLVTTPDGHRECALLTWTPGRSPDRPLSDADVRDLAVLSARLHEASDPVPDLPVGVLDGQAELHFPIPDVISGSDDPRLAVFRAALPRARDAIAALWASADQSPRLVHSDLTPNNVLRGAGGLAAIDFQDLTWAHVEQDIASTLFGITRGVDVAPTVRLFRAAYEQLRPWPRLDDDLLDALFTARRLEMVNLALTMNGPGLEEYLQRHAAALGG